MARKPMVLSTDTHDTTPEPESNSETPTGNPPVGAAEVAGTNAMNTSTSAPAGEGTETPSKEAQNIKGQLEGHLLNIVEAVKRASPNYESLLNDDGFTADVSGLSSIFRNDKLNSSDIAFLTDESIKTLKNNAGDLISKNIPDDGRDDFISNAGMAIAEYLSTISGQEAKKSFNTLLPAILSADTPKIAKAMDEVFSNDNSGSISLPHLEAFAISGGLSTDAGIHNLGTTEAERSKKIKEIQGKEDKAVNDKGPISPGEGPAEQNAQAQEKVKEETPEEKEKREKEEAERLRQQQEHNQWVAAIPEALALRQSYRHGAEVLANKANNAQSEVERQKQLDALKAQNAQADGGGKLGFFGSIAAACRGIKDRGGKRSLEQAKATIELNGEYCSSQAVEARQNLENNLVSLEKSKQQMGHFATLSQKMQDQMAISQDAATQIGQKLAGEGSSPEDGQKAIMQMIKDTNGDVSKMTGLNDNDKATVSQFMKDSEGYGNAMQQLTQGSMQARKDATQALSQLATNTDFLDANGLISDRERKILKQANEKGMESLKGMDNSAEQSGLKGDTEAEKTLKQQMEETMKRVMEAIEKLMRKIGSLFTRGGPGPSPGL